MIRQLLLPVAFAATAALAVTAVANDPPPAAKPPVNQGIVPDTPSDPISDYGLGATGYVLPGQGYVISTVKKNGPAKRVGLEAGDIIRNVDGKPITTEASWTLAMKGKDRVTLLVLDGRDPTAPPTTKKVNLKQ